MTDDQREQQTKETADTIDGGSERTCRTCVSWWPDLVSTNGECFDSLCLSGTSRRNGKDSCDKWLVCDSWWLWWRSQPMSRPPEQQISLREARDQALAVLAGTEQRLQKERLVEAAGMTAEYPPIRTFWQRLRWWWRSWRGKEPMTLRWVGFTPVLTHRNNWWPTEKPRDGDRLIFDEANLPRDMR